MDLPRVNKSLLATVMFIRPRRPDDHRQFEQVLPQCTPLLIYADERGRDWVRWSVPKTVAQRFGWDMRCTSPGCNCTEEATVAPDSSFLVDMAWNEVDWYLERADA